MGRDLFSRLTFTGRVSLALVALGAATSSHAAEAPEPPEMVGGRAAYEKGDCFRSINEYRKAVSAYHLSRKQRIEALHHASYCHFLIGDLDVAIRGFQHYLRAVPRDSEARLRLAQAYYRLERFEAARAEAEKVTDPSFVEEAWLTSVYSSLELGQQGRAIDLIERVEPTEEQKTGFQFWKGAAQFQRRDYRAARETLLEVEAKLPADHWMRREARSMLDQIKPVLKRVRGQVTLGYLFDSNVAQRSTVTVDQAQVPLSPAPNSSTYLRDRAFWAEMNFTVLLHQSRFFRLEAAVDASSPYYQHNPGYNNQNLSGTVDARFTPGSQWSFGGSAKLWDSRYKYIYYQNYLVIDPYVNWSPSGSWSLRGDISYTFYMNTNMGRIFSPTLTARRDLASWMAALLSLSYTRAHGQSAIYPPHNPAVVAGGQAFSRYISRAIGLGTELSLPFDLSLTAMAYRLWTDFEHESLPGTSVQSTFPAREDKAWIFSGDLTIPLQADRLFVGVSSTYTSNRSHGYQGTPTRGLRNDYNYDRLYTSYSTTLRF